MEKLEKATQNRDKKLKAFQDARENFIKTQAELDEAEMGIAQVRTESYNSRLVEQARSQGINPDNFDSEEQLRKAVNPDGARTVNE